MSGDVQTATTGQALEIKIAHLGLIQGVVGRMSSSSLALKSLAVTVGAATIAASSTQWTETWVLAGVGGLPVAVFWALDAYYLHIERAFRCLYDAVRRDEPIDPFTMDSRPFRKRVASPLQVAFTASVCPPYVAVVLILLLVAVFAGGGSAKSEGPNTNERLVLPQGQ